MDEHLPNIDPELLDQLIDGELPDDQRHELLHRLEQEPGGWRTCALAFLEAQCFRETLRAAPRQESAEFARIPPPKRSWLHGQVATVLAMAASFIVALGIGLWLRDVWRGQGLATPGASQLAVSPDETPRLRPQVEPEPGNAVRGMPRTMMVSLPGAALGGQGSVRLPVTEHDGLDESWTRTSPDLLPPEMREMLSRSGCEVRQSRQLLPLPMNDGRRLVVPVDDVEVRYVGETN
jgi:hypothetical protein